MKLYSPHPFKESILLFGGGGAGKSENVAAVARSMATGTMHIYDNDVTYAWSRILAAEDLEDRVVVHEAEQDWESCIETVEKMVANGEPDAGDWLVLDTVTPTWEWVQSWYLETVYGHDLSQHIVELRAAHKDDLKEYHRAILEDMNWPAVKKEYARLYRALHKWKGHLLVTAEAKELGRKEDAAVRMMFGHLGLKPSGEGRLHHVCSTNLLCVHKSRNEWELNTAKDRKREELEHESVDDFAVDYLMEVAGWLPVRGKKS